MSPDLSSNQHGAGNIPGPMVNQPVYPDQQSFAPAPESTASYPFQHGSVPRSSVVQPGQRDSRFASIITRLILLATLLLLGFSVYLAVQLDFINLPFINGGGTPTPPANGLIEVPDLHNMSWLDALAKAEKAGFRLVSVTGQTEGVVVDQNPKAHDKAAKDSTIDVRMEVLTSTVPALTSPGNPVCYISIAALSPLVL